MGIKVYPTLIVPLPSDGLYDVRARASTPSIQLFELLHTVYRFGFQSDRFKPTYIYDLGVGCSELENYHTVQ
eukprot:scaffold6651_cov99-Cylindrotheca_fusiformis.AAC.4